MDGSVSTLAPLLATALATQRTHTAFLIGLAAAIGSGISMAFSEGLSDDGTLTGRGNPVLRGAITGLMTMLGGIGHALPFLLPNIRLALLLTSLVVGAELLLIAYIRFHFFKMAFWPSIWSVLAGGGLVLLAAMMIGTA
jgi:hypothetical protein